MKIGSIELGWKSVAAAAVVAVSAVLKHFGLDEIAEAVFSLGVALGIVGLRHAVAKHHMLLIAPLLALSLTLTACAGKQWTPPAECEGDVFSIILERIPNPKEASLVLQLANLQLLKKHAYGVEDAKGVLDMVDALLNRPITYLDLYAYVASQFGQINSKYGAEIFLISQYMELASEPIQISSCDKALIRAHLAKQRTVLMLAGE
jgi:hypothetical protein